MKGVWRYLVVVRQEGARVERYGTCFACVSPR